MWEGRECWCDSKDWCLQLGDQGLLGEVDAFSKDACVRF